jgi:hypothetical protein
MEAGLRSTDHWHSVCIDINIEIDIDIEIDTETDGYSI